ncbi:hypothetical protein JCM3775_006682 [Rhodotorula graminis]
MLARISILVALACALVVASPLPQVADTPVSTLSINPAAPSPDVSSSNETSSNTTNPGANLSQLLGNLNELQSQNGAGADAVDAESNPSPAFSNFGGDSPADQGQGGGAAPLGGLLASIKQATDMTSGMSLEGSAGGPTQTSAQVLAVETTTAAPEVATSASITDPAVLAAATATAAASAIETPSTFDLNNFLAGASFPAQATTAIAGLGASAA